MYVKLQVDIQMCNKSFMNNFVFKSDLRIFFSFLFPAFPQIHFIYSFQLILPRCILPTILILRWLTSLQASRDVALPVILGAAAYLTFIR